MARVEALYDKVRGMCLDLPDVSEVMAYGHPNFRAGKKMFVAFEDYRGKPSIAFRVPLEQQRALAADARFAVPRAGGSQGWICRILEDVTVTELRALVQDAYRACAPKRRARE